MAEVVLITGALAFITGLGGLVYSPLTRPHARPSCFLVRPQLLTRCHPLPLGRLISRREGTSPGPLHHSHSTLAASRAEHPAPLWLPDSILGD